MRLSLTRLCRHKAGHATRDSRPGRTVAADRTNGPEGAWRRRRLSWSMSVQGGFVRYFPPPLPMINPFFFVRSLGRCFPCAAGTLVFLSFTSSTPCMSPTLRTSPMMGCFSCSSLRRSLLLQDLLSQAQCLDLFSRRSSISGIITETRNRFIEASDLVLHCFYALWRPAE